jgi:hypothetical protein
MNPSAWVEAKFGGAGCADCVTDGGLVKYIVDHKAERKLRLDRRGDSVHCPCRAQAPPGMAFSLGLDSCEAISEDGVAFSVEQRAKLRT